MSAAEGTNQTVQVKKHQRGDVLAAQLGILECRRLDGAQEHGGERNFATQFTGHGVDEVHPERSIPLLPAQ
jgi:hypothetical protein